MSEEISNRDLKGSFEVRAPNWLPVPSCEKGQLRQNVEEGDMFPKADVVEFFQHQGRGIVQRHDGRQYDFSLEEIEVVGPNPSSQISVGMKVGYDLSRTSHGTKITKLKIY